MAIGPINCRLPSNTIGGKGSRQYIASLRPWCGGNSVDQMWIHRFREATGDGKGRQRQRGKKRSGKRTGQSFPLVLQTLYFINVSDMYK